MALGGQPRPLEVPSVFLSCMFESLARLLGDCLIPLRPTDVQRLEEGLSVESSPARHGPGPQEMEIWVLVLAANFPCLCGPSQGHKQPSFSLLSV